jgi:hypothetical protein
MKVLLKKAPEIFIVSQRIIRHSNEEHMRFGAHKEERH